MIGMEKYPIQSRMEIYRRARQKYGDRHQEMKAMEEMAELMAEVARYQNHGGNLVHLAEEMADVYITLEQLQIILGIEDLTRWMIDAKIDQLRERLRAQ